jgi:hypothetical protein
MVFEKAAARALAREFFSPSTQADEVAVAVAVDPPRAVNSERASPGLSNTSSLCSSCTSCLRFNGNDKTLWYLCLCSKEEEEELSEEEWETAWALAQAIVRSERMLQPKTTRFVVDDSIMSLRLAWQARCRHL